MPAFPERYGGDHNPNAEQIGLNYETAENLDSRFDLYRDYTEPPLNFDTYMIDSLGLAGSETLIDLGCSRGHLIQSLRRDFRHTGKLIGIEPHIGQLTRSQEAMQWYASDGGESTLFARAWAHELPIASDSADVVVAGNMFYHIPEEQQGAAFAEIKRVLKKDEEGNIVGRFVLTTSDASNKARHRAYEAWKAHALGVEPPPYMNNGFNTQRALSVLPSTFPEVWHFSQRAQIVLRDEKGVDQYMSSQLSLDNLFTPPIQRIGRQFMPIELVMRTKILERALSGQGFTDRVARDIFICSFRQISRPHENFERVV